MRRSGTWRLAAIAVVTVMAIGVAACQDDDGGGGRPAPVATSDLTSVAATPGAVDTPTTSPAEASPPSAGDEGEVQGIVGSVDVDQNTIIINRISGADVRRVVVTASTDVKDTQGRDLRLTQIRPSDRIVARGTVEGVDLIADDVTIGQVVPGTSPG